MRRAIGALKGKIDVCGVGDRDEEIRIGEVER